MPLPSSLFWRGKCLYNSFFPTNLIWLWSCEKSFLKLVFSNCLLIYKVWNVVYSVLFLNAASIKSLSGFYLHFLLRFKIHSIMLKKLVFPSKCNASCENLYHVKNKSWGRWSLLMNQPHSYVLRVGETSL